MHRFALAALAVAVFSACGSDLGTADDFVQTGQGLAGDSFEPVPWPLEPEPGDCGETCGQWQPYTRFQQGLRDARDKDPSNGGTSPQNYVNIASSCTDKALPSIYYYLHKHPTDPARDVLQFRWRVSQAPHTYATGPSAGAHRAGDPWNSALWTVLFDLDGSGYRTFAAHIDGSSGSPDSPVDKLAGIWGRLPLQSLDYRADPANIKLLGTLPTAFVDEGSGKLLNFQNSTTPTPNWPNGAGETNWDYGSTRARLVTERPCSEYFVDYQIPMALLDASAHGGPKVDRSTPISMLFCTANSLSNPLQKDCAIQRKWTATGSAPGAFGDYISFDQAKPYAQPIIREVTATAPRSCAETYTLTAKVQDAMWLDPEGKVGPSVRAVSFWSYHDVDGDGVSNDGSQWTWAANASLVPGRLNEWRANWDSRGLPRGKYLIGVQAVDDNTRVDDGMVPSGVDNRTFSYVTSDAMGQAYVGGVWHIDQAHFPSHSPAMSPSAAEDWYGNPLITGVQVAGTGVDIALNACGISPKVEMTAAPEELVPGQQVDFAITVSNAGNPFPITVSSITASLPASFGFVGGSTGGAFGSVDPVISGGGLTWTFGAPPTIAPGGSSTLTFAATAGSGAGHYNAKAVAATSFGRVESEPVPLTVYAARASLSLTPDRYLIPPDGTSPVTYTIDWTNDAPVALEGATLTSAIPAGANFVGCAGGNGCTVNAGLATWQLGTIEAGGAGSATITLTLDPSFGSTSFANSVTLRALAPDGTELQRTATSTIAVLRPAPAFRLAMSASALRDRKSVV